MKPRIEKNNAFALRAKCLYALANPSAPVTTHGPHGLGGRSTKTAMGGLRSGIDSGSPRRMRPRDATGAAAAAWPMPIAPHKRIAQPPHGRALRGHARAGRQSGRHMTLRTVLRGRLRAPSRRRNAAARGPAHCYRTVQAGIPYSVPPTPSAPALASLACAARSSASSSCGPASAPAPLHTLPPALPAHAHPVRPPAPFSPRHLPARTPAPLLPAAALSSSFPTAAALSCSGCDRARRMAWVPVCARSLHSRSMAMPCAGHARTRTMTRRAGRAIGASGGGGVPESCTCTPCASSAPPWPERRPAAPAHRRGRGVAAVPPLRRAAGGTRRVAAAAGARTTPLPPRPTSTACRTAALTRDSSSPPPLFPPQAPPSPSASACRTTARLANFGGPPARPAPSAPPHAHAGGLVRPAGGPCPSTFSPSLRGPRPCASPCPPLPPRAFPHVGAGGPAAGGVLRRLRQGAPYAGGAAVRRRVAGAGAATSTCAAGPLRAPCTAHAPSPPAYRTMTRLADFDNLPARTVPRSSVAPAAHCATAILADLGMPRPHRPPPPVRRTAARPGRLGAPLASSLHSRAPSPTDHASRFASPAASLLLRPRRTPSCPASQAERPGGGLCRAGAIGACTAPRTAEPFRAPRAAPVPAAPARRTATRTGDLGGPPPPCSAPGSSAARPPPGRAAPSAPQAGGGSTSPPSSAPPRPALCPCAPSCRPPHPPAGAGPPHPARNLYPSVRPRRQAAMRTCRRTATGGIPR